MDHGEGDWERPVVHLLVQDVFVVHDDGEAEEDPYGHVCVREDDLLHHALAQRPALSHFFSFLELCFSSFSENGGVSRISRRELRIREGGGEDGGRGRRKGQISRLRYRDRERVSETGF